MRHKIFTNLIMVAVLIMIAFIWTSTTMSLTAQSTDQEEFSENSIVAEKNPFGLGGESNGKTVENWRLSADRRDGNEDFSLVDYIQSEVDRKVRKIVFFWGILNECPNQEIGVEKGC